MFFLSSGKFMFFNLLLDLNKRLLRKAKYFCDKCLYLVVESQTILLSISLFAEDLVMSMMGQLIICAIRDQFLILKMQPI